MGWKKSPVKLPFLSSITQILGAVKSGTDAFAAVLDVALSGLKAARVVFASTADPFVILFSALLDQIENLIKDTFDAGIYSLVVDPRHVAGSRVRTINSAFPTSLDSDTLLTPAQIEARTATLQKDGTDPILTYNAMRAKVAFKRSNWKYDNFGIPLMTPNQCLYNMISSLDDEEDPNRPVFSDTANIAAVGFIVSAPDLQKFIELAQPLLDILDIEPLLDLLNNFKIKSKRVTTIPKGGQLPDWSKNARLSDLGFMKAQRDALLSALAQVRAITDTGADKSVARLFTIITQKLQALDDVVKEFSDLLSKLSSTLDAQGIYVLSVDGIGGNNYLKSQLRTFDNSALTLPKDTTGYTFGYLMIGAGPSYEAVRSLGNLLLALRELKIVGGANAKQKVTFSAVPANGSKIRVGNSSIDVDNSDPVKFRKDLQSGVNTIPPLTDCIVLLSTFPKNEESTVTDDGFNSLPGILSAEKTGLGFVVEFQGKDGRKPQDLLDFSDPGLDTIQEICFNEVPISGYFTLSLNGVLTPAIPFDTTAASLEILLNDVPGVFNKVSVSGSFADCFTLVFKNIAVVVNLVDNFLIGSSGPIMITSTLLQAGRDPSNGLYDKDGRPIVITVETIVEGRRNDLCED